MASKIEDIRETVSNFMRTVETFDLARCARFFEEDAQMFSPVGAFPKRLDGRAAILKQFEAIFSLIRQSPEPFKIEPYDLDIREFGSMALVTFHLRQPGPVHRRTFVMRETADGWRIVHIHASIASPT